MLEQHIFGDPALAFNYNLARDLADQNQDLTPGQMTILAIGAAIQRAKANRVYLKQSALIDSAGTYIPQVNRDRRSSERVLIDAATRDPLTGLYNAKTFFESIDDAVSAARRTEPEIQAVAILDLNRFKQVNDQYGHLKGNDILKETAEYLEAQFPDAALVARMGGDEFGVRMKASTGSLDVYLQDLLPRLEGLTAGYQHIGGKYPVEIDAQTHHPTFSIGIAPIVHGRTAEEVLAAADAHMYTAKKAYKAGGSNISIEYGVQVPDRR